MKTTTSMFRIRQLAAASAATGFMATAVLAQHVPGVHGSLDAITVLPTATAPAATQPTTVIPAGHPQLNAGGGQSISSLHEGMAAAKTGAVRVIVSQGTKDGPAIGRDSARVELLSKGVVIKTYLTQVDEKGVIELHDLPLDVPFQPVVTIIHGGAEQQRVGAAMHKYQPAIEFDMPVFETTDVKPGWTIGLRDVEAQAVPSESGGSETYVRLTDMIGVFNPSDHAWTGEQVGDGRQTLAVALPANAGNVQFGPGMAEAGAKVVDGQVVRGKTMLPGSAEYMFAYDVLVKDGKATVSFTSPADTTLFALYVPGDWKIINTTGLEIAAAGGAHAAGKAQLIKARSLKAGSVVSIELGGITVLAAATRPAETVDHTTDLHLPQPPQK